MTTPAPRLTGASAPSLALLVAITASTLLLTGCGGGRGDRHLDQRATDQQATASETSTPPARAPAPAPATAPSVDDLSDFPLAAGWPADEDAETAEAGLTLPIATLRADFADYACGGRAPEPAAARVLRGQFSNVEDYRTRELVVLADADHAAAWVDRLRAFYEACPVVSEDELAYPVTVLDTARRDQSFGVVRTTRYRGEPAIGLSALQVVRRGPAVLLDSSSGEGMARDPRAEGPRVLDELAGDTVEVVAAMCRFTEAGC